MLVAIVAIAGGLGAGAVTMAGCLVFDDKRLPEVDAGPPATPWAQPHRSFLELHDAVRACRWVLECPHLAPSLGRTLALPVDDRSFSLCLHWMAGERSPGRPGFEAQRALLHEVAAADSCAKALAAMWVEEIDPDTDARCSGGGKAHCDGAAVVDCDQGLVDHCDSQRYAAASDCALKNGKAFCATGTCEPPADAGALSSTCSGETATVCADPVGAGDAIALGYSCPPLGLTCGKADAFCTPEGGFVACLQPGELHCNLGGDVVEFCFGTLGGSAWDCGTLEDGRCTSDGPPRCVREGDACSIPAADASAAAGVDTCSGNTLRACVDGQRIDVDCAAADLGLVCLPNAGDRSGRCGTAAD